MNYNTFREKCIIEFNKYKECNKQAFFIKKAWVIAIETVIESSCSVETEWWEVINFDLDKTISSLYFTGSKKNNEILPEEVIKLAYKDLCKFKGIYPS